MEIEVKRKNTVIIAIISILIVSFTLIIKGNENIPEKMYSLGYAIIDGDNGRLLYGKDENKMYPMASTTKIMTCILALENGNLDDEVEISPYAASMPDVQLNVKAGEKYRLGDLLYSLMLESHNDVAVAIAEHISGSVEAFSKLMNEKAGDLGCANALFITPNGLDATTDEGEHSISAYDLALIMSYCIRNEKFCEITTAKSHVFTDISGKVRYSVSNKNALLNMMDGVISGKTGYTGKAGYCYVCAVKRDERTFVIALLGAGWPPKKNYKWTDVKTLIKYGESNYFNNNIYKQENYIKNIRIKNGKSDSVWTYSDKNIDLNICEDDVIEKIYNIPDEINAPVKRGELAGTVEIYINKELYSVVPVKIYDNIEKRDFKFWCNKVLDIFLP